jgi:hypothetical protein
MLQTAMDGGIHRDRVEGVPKVPQRIVDPVSCAGADFNAGRGGCQSMKLSATQAPIHWVDV